MQDKMFHKKKKKDYYENKHKWLQECDAKNDSRKLYKQVNRTMDGFQAKPLSSWSIEGDILSGKADILSRWKEYFQNLYGMTG
jgi:hypothetical protein